MDKKAFKADDKNPALHDDFSQLVAVDTTRMEWEPSPAKGVWRKRLEVIHGERTQLTTVVKFEPGCSFDSHGHPDGEEFIVLSGVFSDDTGDFAEGCYVRNPEGYHHAPYTDEGCEILVKLCQFQANDKERKHIDTAQKPSLKNNGGIQSIPLHIHKNENVILYHLEANASVDTKSLSELVEFFILKGRLEINTKSYTKGAWIRSPVSKINSVKSLGECSFYLKTLNTPSERQVIL